MHEEFSRGKNFWYETTDDFLLETKTIGDKILIKPKNSGRKPFPSKITMSLAGDSKTVIKVRITPKTVGFIWQLPVVLFVLFIPSPLVLKIGFIALLYLIAMIGFEFDVWWTRDLFEKKLLKN